MKQYKKIVGFGLLLIFLVVFITKLDSEQIFKTLELIDPSTYVILFGLQGLTLAISAFLWFYPLKKREKQISFLNIFRINSASGLIESVTPSSKLGGEAAKIVLLKRHTNLSKTDLVAYTVLNKLVTFLPFMIVSVVLVGGATMYFNIPSPIVASLAVILLIFFGLFIASIKLKNVRLEQNNKISKICLKVQEVLNFSRKIVSVREFFLLNGVSLAVWLLYPVKVFVVSEMFAMDIPFVLIAVSLFCAYCISLLPITPGGLGAFEATFALVLSLNGFDFQAGVLLAASARIVTYWMPLLVSAISWLTIVIDSGKFKSLRHKEKAKKIVLATNS